jgi:CDGSH-type Zn-finger protein/uncharacterized Fe-S cluster protein YjdI
MSQIERVVGSRITIVFDGSRCIHSRHCVLDRPDVFVPNVAGEWIHPDAATADEVRELAHNCPSGAIRYEPVAGEAAEGPPRVNTMRIRENGPLALHASLTVGADSSLRATLCRCGLSRNKPYCDASHHAGGFAATGEPVPLPDGAAPAQRDGPLEVEAIENGPLHLSGALEIVTGTGRTLARLAECWLCRCGQSANKPFCDGSHKRAAFQAAGVARGSRSA